MPTKIMNSHLSEDALELYSLGRLAESELDGVEEHLLVCSHCQDRLAETDDFVKAVRSATAELEQHPVESWRSKVARLFEIPKPVWAAGGALAAAALLMPVFRPGLESPAVVDLASYRDAAAATAQVPAGKPLELRLATAGIDVNDAAVVEIVNTAGARKWEGHPSRNGAAWMVKVPVKLDAGQYWVRIYSDGGKSDLAREYSLLAR